MVYSIYYHKYYLLNKNFFLLENQIKKYLLIMEYADGGSLKQYLKKNFSNLSRENKYGLAYQLAYAVLCLHNEGIIHRDLVIYSSILMYLLL